MRKLILLSLISIWVSLYYLKFPCFSENNTQFCKLGPIECGYTLKGTDNCGVVREVICTCNNNNVCDSHFVCK